jgi:hypothetical protein
VDRPDVGLTIRTGTGKDQGRGQRTVAGVGGECCPGPCIIFGLLEDESYGPCLRMLRSGP